MPESIELLNVIGWWNILLQRVLKKVDRWVYICDVYSNDVTWWLNKYGELRLLKSCSKEKKVLLCPNGWSSYIWSLSIYFPTSEHNSKSTSLFFMDHWHNKNPSLCCHFVYLHQQIFQGGLAYIARVVLPALSASSRTSRGVHLHQASSLVSREAVLSPLISRLSKLHKGLASLSAQPVPRDSPASFPVCFPSWLSTYGFLLSDCYADNALLLCSTACNYVSSVNIIRTVAVFCWSLLISLLVKQIDQHINKLYGILL